MVYGDTVARVLLLLPATSYRAHDFLAAARKLGVDVAVGSDQRQVLEKEAPGGTLTLDFNDPDGATRAIARFAEAYPLQGVVGADDETTALAAQAAEALGLPFNPPEAVRATRNKFALREALKPAGLPAPRFQLVPCGADPRAASPELGFPCVLKPTFLSASRGVLRANDATEFGAAFDRISAILAEAEVKRRGGKEAQHILVEEYVPGEEFAVEGILSSGELGVLALFDKPDPLEGPVFEETIYVTPSRAARETQDRILESVQRAVHALDLREGPVHAEVRVNPRGAYVIEIAARAIGGLCPRVLRFGAGLSLEELILRHATGEDISSVERESRAAGVMMIPIPRAGILRGARGLERGREVRGIEAIVLSIPIGQEVVPLPEGHRYLGFIFARAETPEEAEAALREAHRELEIEISGPVTSPARSRGSSPRRGRSCPGPR